MHSGTLKLRRESTKQATIFTEIIVEKSHYIKNITNKTTTIIIEYLLILQKVNDQILNLVAYS